MILIPPKRLLLDQRPELRTEKYESNFHVSNYVQNTNDILNFMNKVRGWHQNGSRLSEHITNCLTDVKELAALANYQFQGITDFPSGNPMAHIVQVTCNSFVNSISWPQLKSEVQKGPKLTNLSEVISLTQTLYRSIKSRAKCLKCGLYVLKLTKHEKTHGRLQLQQDQIAMYKLQAQCQQRNYFREISETFYAYTNLDDLYS